MSTPERAPRIWIDVEHGARFGSPAASIDSFTEFRNVTAPVREVWLFHRPTSPLLRGFYYPLATHQRFAVPRGTGPGMVVIDRNGDQMWFGGASCGPGEKAAAAAGILEEIGYAIPAAPGGSTSPLAPYDEMHFGREHLSGGRPIGDPVPASPPGRTFVRDRKLVNRMEFDKGGVSAHDLRQLWRMAVEPGGWLGPPASLLLYDSRRRAEESGHDGCQVIARGESGRELWLQLPEPDDFDRLAPGRRRPQFEGAVTEYDSVKQSIFREVGIDIDPPDDRSFRDRLMGRHRPPPPIIRWP
ncbi:hypothetical protein ACVBEQ_04180 [Nakamurella sp. GG22]